MTDHKIDEAAVRALLARVKPRGAPRDIISLGMVVQVEVADDAISIRLRLPAGRREIPEEIASGIEAALAETGRRVALALDLPAEAEGPDEGLVGLADVDKVLAVTSAKGGVGKSTVASNLACAFAATGLRVGLLDADVYGPSLPIMMGAQDRPRAADGKRFHPIEAHGVRCISMGFFLDDESPVIWRGPMVSGLLQQFLGDCVWGGLDLLVVDLPPGTGDTQLTLAQQVSLDGALLVTTPQDVALRDVVRGVAMLRQLQVPLLGVIENMSHFHCPSCGEADAVFGSGGGAAVALAAGVDVLAQVPLELAVREQGDAGTPVVLAHPDSPAAEAFTRTASRLLSGLGLGSAAGASLHS
jgi:ATP-binding protein involved in chromosome partitioning